jgi:hypothetical protein
MRALATLLLLASCGGPSLPSDVPGILQRDRHLAMYGYIHADGGALSADVKRILCDQERILLEYGQTVDDAGVRCR